MRTKRTRRLRLALGFAAIAVIAVAAATAMGSATTDRIDGIPQEGLTLGDPSAPVEPIEYGDLECTICKADAEGLLPRVIRTQVRTGKAKLTFRNFAIVDPRSFAAGAAAIAAGEQGRGWSFIELFLHRQGKPGSGYVTDKFLESIATAAGVDDLAAWNQARQSSEVRAEVKATTKEARHELGLIGTPTFAIKGPRIHGLKILGAAESAAALEAAIKAAG